MHYEVPPITIRQKRFWTFFCKISFPIFLILFIIFIIYSPVLVANLIFNFYKLIVQ